MECLCVLLSSHLNWMMIFLLTLVFLFQSSVTHYFWLDPTGVVLTSDLDSVQSFLFHCLYLLIDLSPPYLFLLHTRTSLDFSTINYTLFRLRNNLYDFTFHFTKNTRILMPELETIVTSRPPHLQSYLFEDLFSSELTKIIS